MPRIRDIDRALVRHRRATALLGTLVVLGVAALNVHSVLPEHHHVHGEETVCIAALAVAGLAALGWRRRCEPRLPVRIAATLVRFARGVDVPRTSRLDVSARAGPAGLAVLRL